MTLVCIWTTYVNNKENSAAFHAVCVCICFLRCWQQRANISVKEINRLFFTLDTERLLCLVGVYPTSFKFYFVKNKLIWFSLYLSRWRLNSNEKTISRYFTTEDNSVLLSCPSSDSWWDFLFKSVDRYCLHGPEASSLTRRGISPLSVCQYYVMSSFVQIYVFQFIINTKSYIFPIDFARLDRVKQILPDPNYPKSQRQISRLNNHLPTAKFS